MDNVGEAEGPEVAGALPVVVERLPYPNPGAAGGVGVEKGWASPDPKHGSDYDTFLSFPCAKKVTVARGSDFDTPPQQHPNKTQRSCQLSGWMRSRHGGRLCFFLAIYDRIVCLVCTKTDATAERAALL